MAWLLALGGLLWSVFRLYSLAFGGGAGFDDDANLRGLATVVDAQSALQFVLGGNAGPLGRPLALLSFLVDAPAWPLSPEALLRTNSCIHLLNVVLVAWLALRLAPLLPVPPQSPAWFALTVAAFWGTAPLLMSASLLTVQRMTTLSASFALAAAIGYVAARTLLATRPLVALLGMGFAVGVGTLMAALCKETGALVPLLLAVTEAILLRRACGAAPAGWAARAWLLWRCVFFVLPALLLVAWGVLQLRDLDTAFQGRGYGLLQRLLSESRILFVYLRLLLLPQRSGLGPFQDDFPLSSGWLAPVSSLVAVCAWVLFLGVAWRLRAGRWRVASFGIGWFLVGHVLESTVFPLEPYFEHRNYLPAVGVAFAVCALLWGVGGPSARAARVVLVLLLANAAFVAREHAIVWGDARLSGPLWAAEHPDSFRALMHYSRSVGMQGDIERAVAIFDAAPAQMQASPHYVASRLQLYCGTQPRERVAQAAAALEGFVARGRVDYGTPQSIGVALDFAAMGRCEGFDPELGRAALEAVLAVPPQRLMARALPVAHEILARYWTRKRRLDLTMQHLEQEYALGGAADTVTRMVVVLGSAQRCDLAAGKLEEAAARPSAHPLQRIGWRLQLRAAREAYAAYCGDDSDGS